MRLLLASLLVVAAASQTLADDAKGDAAKVQGKWTALVGPEKNIPIVLEIKDNTVSVIVTVEGEERTLKGEFKLDETKTPKHWTWTKFKGPDGEEMEDNPAIYKLDGDELTVCNGGPGNARPSEFKAANDPGANLIVLKRKKEEKEKK